MHPQWEGCGKG